jgi:hypothetical protein
MTLSDVLRSAVAALVQLPSVGSSDRLGTAERWGFHREVTKLANNSSRRRRQALLKEPPGGIRGRQWRLLFG